VSRKIGEEYVKAFEKMNPQAVVAKRDLAKKPIPHLDIEAISASYVPAADRPSSMQDKHCHRLKLIKEITTAKSIVVTAPMWNWSIPSVLKAYIDQIVLFGVLDNRDNKKLAGKKVTIILASGSGYGPDSWHPEWDFETNYLVHIFTALGATDVKVIRAEYTMAGMVPGMESFIPMKEKSIADAISQAVQRSVEATVPQQ